jgi:hypothetical protein
MKLSDLWKKTKDGTVGVHYCKKCGCPLTSTNKDKLCDNCRRKDASNLRIVLGVLGTLVLGIISIVAPDVLKKALGGLINRKL